MNSSISQSFSSSATSNPTQLDKNLILEAHQKSFQIDILGRREYDIQKDKLLNQQHKNINEEFDRKLNNINMEKKMQRSQAINSKRIKKMNARNDLMKQLIEEAKKLLKEKMQKNSQQYYSLLRELILQGMVKLLENHIFIKCQYQDIEIIKDLIPDCQKKFKEIFKPIDEDSLARYQAERKRAQAQGQAEITQEFHIPDRHIDVQLVEELSPEEEKSLESGGVILFNGEGTIVVNNTLIERLILAYQETLPTIREILFPSLTHTVPVFGYWGFRGAGESIRLTLEYSGVKYVDKRYYTREDWFVKDKYNLGLEFPNLPYLIDGQNVKMTESLAILRYIAQKWRPDLLGTTPKERGTIQMFLSQLDGLRKEIVRTLFDKNNFEEKKTLFFKKQSTYLESLNKFIKKHGKNFLTGDFPRLCDFSMHEVSGMLFLLEPSLKYKYNEFVRVQKNLAACSRIQEYLASQKFSKLHFAPGLAAVEQNIDSVYGYWGIRGRGQANRWAIAFTKANVKEVKYQGIDQWQKDKFSIGLEYPNLPYFLDADTGESLTESLAVLKYICFKYNPDLLGKSPGQKGYIEMLLGNLKAMEDGIIQLVWDKAGFEQRRPKEIAKWTVNLDNLHSTVQRHGQNFLSGSNVRACDFLFYEVSQKLLLVFEGFAKKYPLFMALRRNFEDLAQIKKAMKSQSYVPIVFPPGQTAVNNM